MPKTFEQIRNLSILMEEADTDRDLAYKDYRDMYHLNYELPDEIRQLQWVRKIVAQDPHDAIASGKRVLSSIFPTIKYQPLIANDLNKKRANLVEKNLAWQLRSANSRRSAKVEEDLVESALLYMACAVMIIDLDWHIKQLEAQGKDTKRAKRARKQGRFLVNVYSPDAVHVRNGSFGTEAVLLKVERPASDVLTEWGDTEDGALSLLAIANETVYYYDFIDYDDRTVWISPIGNASTQRDEPNKGTQIVPSGDIVLLEPTEHNLEFNPWVAEIGGSTIETDPKHKHQPMLYAVRESRSWETLNIAESLAFSDAIAKAARPEVIEEGPNPQTADMDYTDAAKHMKMPAGNTARPAPTSPLDPGKTELIDRQRQAIEKSTVSSVLQGGALPSNVAFAALNLATQTAVGALKPAKYLAEKTLAEIFKKMLLWTAETGNELEGYISDKEEEEYGQRLSIPGDEIDEETIYIEVELTPDVPTDRQQRANTGALLVQSMDYPKEMALEDVGVSDPTYAMNQSRRERLFDHRMALLMKKQEAEVDAQIQDLMQQVGLKGEAASLQMQMELQQQAAGGQPGAGGGEEVALPPEAEAGGGGGPGADAGAQGGFATDANQGGLPAAMANPEGLTRENVGGLDRGGQPVQGIEGMVAGQGEGLAG